MRSPIIPIALALFAAGCADPVQTLVDTSTIVGGETCELGGIRVETGADHNRDGVLDDHEVTSSAIVCNGPAGQDGIDGTDGTNGTDGTDGIDGTDGTDGANGTDGYDALVRIDDVPAEAGGACWFGGIEVSSGRDLDRDGVLADSEVEDSAIVCNIAVNSHMTLVRHVPELPGAECEAGGIRVDVGRDDNDDGDLADDEIDHSNYLCSEVIIVDGLSTLVDSKAASGAQCPFGGSLFSSGLDHNRNGTLDSDEIDDTWAVCNGDDGTDALVVIDDDGGACGTEGGYAMKSGLDLDFDGVLDASEVQAESLVCNGTDGFLGYDGASSLIDLQDAGAACGPDGGFELSVGLDADGDGLLDASEVTQTQLVCNGEDGEDGEDGVVGHNSLIDMSYEAHISACGTSGIRIESGLDLDADGVLDWGEVTQEEVVCDGAGASALVELTYQSWIGVCNSSGVLIESGQDHDNDGYLDYGEVTDSEYVCDGV